MATRVINPNEYIRMEKEVARLTKENEELKAKLTPPPPNPVITEVIEPPISLERKARTGKAKDEPTDDESTD